VVIAGHTDCRWCNPYERNLPIHVCRDPLLEIRELWPLIKHYD